MRWRELSAIVLLGCSGCLGVSDMIALTPASSAGQGGSETGVDSGAEDEDTGDAQGVLYDVASDESPAMGDPKIPPTCDDAAGMVTSVGCWFQAVDLDQEDGAELAPFGLAVANVQTDATATALVETKVGNSWSPIAGPLDIAPGDARVIDLPDLHQDGTGGLTGGAYRLTTSVPVSVYQLSPIAADAVASSEISLLHPLSAWSGSNQMLGWVTDDVNTRAAYLTIAAAVDGTNVQITPTVDYVPGVGVPPGMAGQPFDVGLNSGDIIEIVAESDFEAEIDHGFSGTTLVSGGEHPIAVFSGHTCASIPEDHATCSHLQEQIVAHNFGQTFVAARFPVRNAADPEPVLWQIHATVDDTTVWFEGKLGTTGLPNGPVVLDAGDAFELYVTGASESDGDFVVSSRHPIAVVAYSVNAAEAAQPDGGGGEAMVQLAPVEHSLRRYVAFAPDGWDHNVAIIARRAGEPVELDGAPVDEDEFHAVGSDYEVARVKLESGVHDVRSDRSFSLMMAGLRPGDGYAYLAGSGLPTPDFDPEG